MTTLVPRKPYTDDELRQLYPSGLELQLVQVLMRHGERTPVSPRFQNTGLHPFWPYCAAVHQLRAVVLEDDKDSGVVDVGRGGGEAATQPLGLLKWKKRLETFGRNDAPELAEGNKGELDAICDMGMLTDPGRATTLRLGHRLRSLYVDRLGFLPKTLDLSQDTTSLFYLRATPIPRALESLQQAFTGMYPEATRGSNGSPPPTVTIVARAPGDETLFPNDSNCRRFAMLSRAYAQRAAVHWNDSEELAYVTKRIGRWLPADSPRVAVDGKPRLSGIMDTVNATLAHGPQTRLPSEFYDDKVRQALQKVALEEWFAGYTESAEYRTLGIGGLMGDLTERMVTRAEAGSSSNQANDLFKFGLSGCHDTTLAAVLTSMGHTLPAWPPFTSHLAVEMFRKADAGAPTTAAPTPSPSSSGWLSFFSKSGSGATGIGRKRTPELTDSEKQKLNGYYVRIRYNDEPIAIPGCKPVGKHLEGDESFCTLAAFKEIVDKFTPNNWRQQCRSNMTEPTFPSKPETAGF